MSRRWLTHFKRWIAPGMHPVFLTTRSDIPCPRPFKRDNVFYHVREGDLFETLQGFANKALLVGHERLFSFASPDANQRNAQVVGQKPDRVQNDTLFAERAS